MGLKEDYEAYKQRKEVQKYFRTQNDLYLDNESWIKVVVVSLLVSIACGLSLGFITELLGWNIMYLYLILGYIVSNTVKSVSGVESKQMAIVSCVMTLLSCVIAQMPFSLLASLNILMALYFAVTTIVNDLFVLMFVIIAVVIAYNNSK